MKSTVQKTVSGVWLLLMIAGCDNKPTVFALPEVNEQNCKPENIAKVQDKATQQKLSSLCLRQGSEFKASPDRKW